MPRVPTLPRSVGPFLLPPRVLSSPCLPIRRAPNDPRIRLSYSRASVTGLFTPRRCGCRRSRGCGVQNSRCTVQPVPGRAEFSVLALAMSLVAGACTSPHPVVGAFTGRRGGRLCNRRRSDHRPARKAPRTSRSSGAGDELSSSAGCVRRRARTRRPPSVRGSPSIPSSAGVKPEIKRRQSGGYVT